MSLQERITGFLHPERVNTPTPATEDGLKSYDRDDPVTAVFKAWNEPGRNLVWHRSKQDQVREVHRPVDVLTVHGETLPESIPVELF